ncbi:MAG: phosphatidylinositol mannoside acyltransferase [Acidimicrobiia bacterium]|nr:phosphatidylinositol mannoside acyltransferase [Acidimicrobiia bacterium]
MKHLLAYYGFRFAAAIFGAFPESWMRHAGEWLGRRGAGRWSDKRPLLKGHMRRVMGPEVSDIEIESAVNRMYESYGRYWAETLWLRPRRHRTVASRVERVGFEHVFKALEEGNGIIFALPHLGSWEVAGLVADEIGAPVLAVAEDLSNERITKWFVDVRNQLGIDIVLTTDPQRRSKLIRRLKEGKVIALLADRDVTGRGLTTEFFGEETKMPSGPVGLAILTGAALIPVGVYFKEGAGHHIEVHPPVEIPQREARDQTVAAGAALMARKLEEIISRDPPQWHLFQPNWPSDIGYRA